MIEMAAWIAIISISFGYSLQSYNVFKTGSTEGLSLNSYLLLSLGFLILGLVSLDQASFKFTIKQVICLIPCLYIVIKIIINKNSKFKLLIIDDDEDVINLFEHFIKKSGREDIYLTSCTNGKCALGIFDKNTYNLIITDLDLNDEYSGFDLIDIIRKKNPQQRIALLTSSFNQQIKEDLRFSFKNKKLIFLKKPFSIDTIEHLIKAAKK
jgi:CheY-like chemotaxis protein